MEKKEITHPKKLLKIFSTKHQHSKILEIFQKFNKCDHEQLLLQLDNEQSGSSNENSEDSDYSDDVDNFDYSTVDKFSNIDVFPNINSTIKSSKYTFTVSQYYDDDTFETLINSLNYKQRMLLYHYASVLRQQVIGATDEIVNIFISGPAGTGKTTLINAINNTTFRIISSCCNKLPEEDPMTLKTLLCAPTAKAAILIGGNTIHSALRIQRKNILTPLTCSSLNTLLSNIADVRTIIFDEASMIGKRLYFHSHSRLCQIFQNFKFMGGKNFFLVGDFYQLAPIRSIALYDSENNLFEDPNSPISCAYLWEKLSFFELTDIMRQKDEKDFATLLTKLSSGLLTKEEYETLQSLCNTSTFDEDESTHLFLTNDEVNKYNTLKMKKKIIPNKTKVIKVDAIDNGSKKKHTRY